MDENRDIIKKQFKDISKNYPLYLPQNEV